MLRCPVLLPPSFTSVNGERYLRRRATLRANSHSSDSQYPALPAFNTSSPCNACGGGSSVTLAHPDVNTAREVVPSATQDLAHDAHRSPNSLRYRRPRSVHKDIGRFVELGLLPLLAFGAVTGAWNEALEGQHDEPKPRTSRLLLGCPGSEH